MIAPPTNTAWPRLHQLIVSGREGRASDLHVTADISARLRVDGELQPAQPGPSKSEVLSFLQDSLSNSQRAEFEARWAADGSYTDSVAGRIRIHARHSFRGIILRLRFLDDKPPPFAELDLPPVLTDWIRRPSGLIIVSGVTGSGKTTLQAALLRLALELVNPSVLTLEDPIEYLFDDDDRVTQGERGDHFSRFEQALSEFMRCDPDVIMLGEVRSPETAQAILTAVESGHTCICTAHASDTSRVFARLLAMFPHGQRDLVRNQLAHHLIGVVGLKLVKRRATDNGQQPGRRATCEILERNDTIKAALLSNKDANEIRDAVTNGGGKMLSMEKHLSQLVARKEIDYDTALAAAEYPDELRRP